jgi:hypothetical protein
MPAETGYTQASLRDTYIHPAKSDNYRIKMRALQGNEKYSPFVLDRIEGYRGRVAPRFHHATDEFAEYSREPAAKTCVDFYTVKPASRRRLPGNFAPTGRLVGPTARDHREAF